MLNSFLQAVATDVQENYVNNLNDGKPNWSVPNRLNRPNLFSGLEPSFTNKYGAGLHNQPTMFDAETNDQLNLMTSVPVTFPQTPILTVETHKDILPARPAIPPTDDLKLKVSPIHDSF